MHVKISLVGALLAIKILQPYTKPSANILSIYVHYNIQIGVKLPKCYVCQAWEVGRYIVLRLVDLSTGATNAAGSQRVIDNKRNKPGPQNYIAMAVVM